MVRQRVAFCKRTGSIEAAAKAMGNNPEVFSFCESSLELLLFDKQIVGNASEGIAIRAFLSVRY